MRPTPTPQHLVWAECEIGVIIHLDVQVFEPSYRFRDQWGYTPSASVFDPAQLDTDQWVATAKAAGAKYAVLVAKHCSGFSLWPTKAHGYSVSSSPWRDGMGDVVRDFFASCERAGVKPGLYCSASVNAHLDVNNPGRVRSGGVVEQKRYNDVVEMQLRELWSNYGEVFEIWFDGGVMSPTDGGPDIVPLLNELQPNAVVFQGPPECRSLLRWVGNERGMAPYPCWSTTNLLSQEDGTKESKRFGGTPDGNVWAPGESDMPNRDQRRAFLGGWFWRAGDEEFLYPVDHLVESYYTSVGRNTNMLLGMVIDDRGLVPDADVAQFTAFGREIARRFASPVATREGSGPDVELAFEGPRTVDHAVIMEDISQGERVRRYALEGFAGGAWTELRAGSCIGHKRIERFASVELERIRARTVETDGDARIASLSAFDVAGQQGG